MITVDIHNHLGMADMNQVHHYAEKRGLSYIGVCEHTFKLTEVCEVIPSYVGYTKSTYTMQDYINNASVSSLHGQTLLRGIELDLYGRQTSVAHGIIQRYHWDFICGGVHFLDGIDLHRLTADTRRDRTAIWARYTKEQVRWVKSGLIDFLVHPLRLACIIRPQKDEMQGALGRLTRAAAKAGVPVEINAIDYYHAPHLVEQLIAACAENGTLVVVGSDSSMPAEMGHGFFDIWQVMTKHGLDRCVAFCSRMAVTVNIHTGSLAVLGCHGR